MPDRVYLVPHHVFPARADLSRDSKADKFLATAVAGNVAHVVSEDQDVLALGEYEGVQIVDSLRFLRILAGGDAEP